MFTASMKLENLLEVAATAGITFGLEDGKIKIFADDEPPPDLINLFILHRDIILEKVLAEFDDWKAWQYRYAVYVTDAIKNGLDDAQARKRAVERCIVKHMNEQNPNGSPSTHCAHCQQPDPAGQIVPFLSKSGHLWLHHNCHSQYLGARRDASIFALEEFGLFGGRDVLVDKYQGTSKNCPDPDTAISLMR